MNMRGPRTERWETEQNRWMTNELLLPRTTLKDLSDRYERNHSRTTHWCSRRRIRRSWSTVLNAAVKSNKHRAETWAWSVYADAWRPALTGYSPASAVQARCDSPSLLQHRAPGYLAEYCVPVSEVLGCQHLWSARCHHLLVPRVREFGTHVFSVADQQSGIHCPIVWWIKLSTLNNLGETWRRICSLDTRCDSTLEVLRNRAL